VEANVNQASARFEQYLNRRFLHSTTPKHYLSDLYIFIAIIGDKTPEEVTAEDIDRFVEHQIAAELKSTTINRRLATLHTFFEYLAGEQPERDWPNPVIRRRHHLRTGFHLPRDLLDEDVDRLFAAITDVRDRAIFGLMVGAGLRVGEVAALHLEDIEPSTQPDQLVRMHVCGKGQKERIVWLTSSLWAVVSAWLQERPPVENDHLFLSDRSRPISEQAFNTVSNNMPRRPV
jgi:integrase/recombinase XerD